MDGVSDDDRSAPDRRSAQSLPAGDPPMTEERLRRIEDGIRDLRSFIDGFRTVPQLALSAIAIALTAVALLLTVVIFSLNNVGAQIRDFSSQIRDVNSQIRDLGARVDAIPRQLAEEFRAMRAETAAQTSAIASSITAARQVQPQILVVPAPGGATAPPAGATP
jgi:capsule polysaccharide export protein KpsE/RkpR